VSRYLPSKLVRIGAKQAHHGTHGGACAARRPCTPHYLRPIIGRRTRGRIVSITSSPLVRLVAEEDDEAPGPQSRGVVVLDRRLETLKQPLQNRNMLVIVAPADDIDDETRLWLLPHRVVIVEDEATLVDDASSYVYGIVSCGLLSNREPARVAKVISDVFVHRPGLWHRRHGWKLILRDDGDHEYEPLVD
jgi:hypothetical protein